MASTLLNFPTHGNLIFINILFLSGVIYLLISVWTLQHRNIKAARTFSVLMATAGFYSLGYYFELKSSDIQELFFWLQVKYMGVPFIPFLWLLFVLQFTDTDRYIKSFYLPLLFIVPFTTFFLVWWGPSINYYYASVIYKEINGFSIPDITPGPWAVVHFTSSNISILTGILILINASLKANRYLRLRYLVLLGGIVIPWIFNVLFLLGVSPKGLDITPFALIITGIIIIIELSQFKLFNVLPLARTRVFDVINNGIIVVDQNNNIADINPWAKISLNIYDEMIGSSIYTLFPGKDQVLKALFNGELQVMEFYWQQEPENKKCFEMWQRPLTSNNGTLLGRLITLTDITTRKESEKALSNERILLRTLVDNIPMSVYVKDINGKKILANKTDLSYMGLENESDAIGKTDYDIYPQELASVFSYNDKQVLETGQPVMDKEEQLNNMGGQEKWLLTSKVPFLDTKGRMLGVLGIGRDITEWKKMQQDFADSEERFRTLTEATSAAVFIFQGNSYIYLNPASEKLTGYSLEEMKQMNFWDIIHPDFQEMVRVRGLNRLFEQKHTRRYEFKIITKDGSVKWLDYSTGVAIYKGKVAAIGTAFDITERKIAEEALSISEQRYRKIFENSNTGILQLFPQGEVINANNAFAQLLGYDSAAELLKEKASILQYLFENEKDKLDFFNRIKQKDYVNNLEFEAKTLSGKKIWIIVNAWKNIDLDNSSYLIEGFFLDITDRKLSMEYQNEVEVARKSSETKNLFLANMSHEIRTPVSGIMGMTDVLSKTSLSPQQADYLNTIEESSRKLLNIINEILDISKIEAGKMELRTEAFNLANMFGSLKSMFGPIAEKNNLILDFNLPDSTPEWLIGDKKRIEQILMNLISNALKFTNQGSVVVNITFERNQTGGFILQVKVKDTGMGINPIDKNRLFHKFSQLDNSSTRASDGTGLGLFICKELIKLMGGEIDVESIPGSGSTFWFSLPLQAGSAPQTGGNINPGDKMAFYGTEILVVDDKLVNQKVLSLMLKGEGCKVEVASNGFEALEKFNPSVHQLIFMDIMMPGMDGITAMKKLQEKYIDPPPIIALTANAMEGDAQAYLASGFNDYLSKPVSREDLREMLIKWTLTREIS